MNKHQKNLQHIQEFCLMDDVFFTKCFEGDTECVQLVLQIVLNKPDLQVLESHTQVFVENIMNRSVRFDVLATDADGRYYNIEIQRTDKGAGYRRARYNSAMIDANLLEKGNDFDALPETYVIFITENDVIGEGRAIYQVERFFVESGIPFDDGTHIVYVNGSYRGNSPIGKLMHDFACKEPSEMNYDVLAERAKFFKESKEGTTIMSKVLEDMVLQAKKEERQENQIETAKRMLKDGLLSIEKVAEYAGLNLDDVKNLSAQESRNGRSLL